MSYLYKLYIVVNQDIEDIQEQTMIDKIIEEAFLDKVSVDIVGARISELNNNNCGKCCKCGTWVSDQEKQDYIDGFSDGIFIDGEWWCDLCVSPEHPKYFN